MNLTDYTFLLNKPDAVNDRKTDALERIVAEFPYFQSARALRLKGLYNQNSFQYNYALKIAAAYTTDRSVLFDFITSDSFTAIHKGLYEQKLNELYNMDVTAVEVTKADPTEDKVEKSILNSIRESENAKGLSVVSETIAPEAESPAVMEIVKDVVDTDASDASSGVDAISTTATEVVPTESVSAETELSSEANQPEPTEKLGIGLPLNFSSGETHSFAEWLQLSAFKPIDRTETPSEEIVEAELIEVPEITPESESPEWQKKQALIDKFIENNPKIPPIKQDYVAQTPELAREDSSLMTETLARVYLEQKKYSKAIQAYEILILKYPEKSIFFADRISEIKKLQQNNS